MNKVVTSPFGDNQDKECWLSGNWLYPKFQEVPRVHWLNWRTKIKKLIDLMMIYFYTVDTRWGSYEICLHISIYKLRKEIYDQKFYYVEKISKK